MLANYRHRFCASEIGHSSNHEGFAVRTRVWCAFYGRSVPWAGILRCCIARACLKDAVCAERTPCFVFFILFFCHRCWFDAYISRTQWFWEAIIKASFISNDMCLYAKLTTMMMMMMIKIMMMMMIMGVQLQIDRIDGTRRHIDKARDRNDIRVCIKDQQKITLFCRLACSHMLMNVFAVWRVCDDGAYSADDGDDGATCLDQAAHTAFTVWLSHSRIKCIL